MAHPDTVRFKLPKPILFCGLIAIVLGLLMLDKRLYSNSHLFSKTDPKITSATEALDDSTEFFRTITNPDLGTYAVVNADKTIISLKDKNNRTIWSTNIALCFSDSEPFPPGIPLSRQIDSMVFTNPPFINCPTNQVLLIYFGREMLGVDVITRRIYVYGTD
jgi:hypothetical protein